MSMLERLNRILTARGQDACPPDLESGNLSDRIDRLLAIEGGSPAPEWLDRAIALKDQLGLRELSEHLDVPVAEISRAFREFGIPRSPPSGSTSRPPQSRPGSKDAAIENYFSLLGKVPDAEVARLAEVSVRTIASYRARHDIAGYSGPRRRPAHRGRRRSKVDDYADLLGRVPDRIVADIAGMSLGAVRNFRIKRNVDPVGRIPPRDIRREVQAWRTARIASGQPDPLVGVQSAALRPLQNTPVVAEARPATAAPLPLATGTLRAWTFTSESGPGSRVVLAGDLPSAVAHARAVLPQGDALRSIADAGAVVGGPP